MESWSLSLESPRIVSSRHIVRDLYSSGINQLSCRQNGMNGLLFLVQSIVGVLSFPAQAPTPLRLSVPVSTPESSFIRNERSYSLILKHTHSFIATNATSSSRAYRHERRHCPKVWPGDVLLSLASPTGSAKAKSRRSFAQGTSIRSSRGRRL